MNLISVSAALLPFFCNLDDQEQLRTAALAFENEGSIDGLTPWSAVDQLSEDQLYEQVDDLARSIDLQILKGSSEDVVNLIKDHPEAEAILDGLRVHLERFS